MTSRMLGFTWGTDRGDECSKSWEGSPRLGSPCCPSRDFAGLCSLLCDLGWRYNELLNIASRRQLARGVIGNTPGFDPGIPSSSLGGPVPFEGMRDEYIV